MMNLSTTSVSCCCQTLILEMQSCSKQGLTELLKHMLCAVLNCSTPVRTLEQAQMLFHRTRPVNNYSNIHDNMEIWLQSPPPLLSHCMPGVHFNQSSVLHCSQCRRKTTVMSCTNLTLVYLASLANTGTFQLCFYKAALQLMCDAS